MTSPTVASSTTVTFPKGTVAQLATVGPRVTAEMALASLGLIGPRSVLLVIGSADGLDAALEPDLRRLFEAGVVHAAAGCDAVVIDGGTGSGVMGVLGAAVAAVGTSGPILGIAPLGRVTYPGDTRTGAGERTGLGPDHTHFLLADSDDWGGETTLMFDAVEAIATTDRVAVVVVGGGAVTLDEVALAARRGMPIVVVTGTGGAADQLVDRSAAMRGATPAEQADLQEALADGEVTAVGLDDDPGALEAILLRLLRPDETLHLAWQQHRMLSRTAHRERRAFGRYQSAVLALGLVATVLVVVRTSLLDAGLLHEADPLAAALRVAIILIPIVVAALVAGAARRRPGSRWVALRGNAELIKRETYRYRTRTGIYAHAQTRRTTRQVKLAQQVGSIANALMRTDVNLAALEPADLDPDGPGIASAQGDDGLRRLDADGYIRFRIDDQIAFYRRGARERERRIRALRWLMIGFGGLGSFLAAIGFELWVAVTVAAVGALAAYLEATQLEATLPLYNQAATSLEAIKAWWTALTPQDQREDENLERLVDRAERVLQAEHANWIEEMQAAVTKTQDDRQGDATGKTAGEADDPVPSDGPT